VHLNPILKKSPPLNSGALWLDAGGKHFYSYDGQASLAFGQWYTPTETQNQFWQFNPDGNSGHWTRAPVSSSAFNSLVEIVWGYYASGNGLGFAMGGFLNYATSNKYDTYAGLPLPGIVTFNSSSGEWTNSSSDAFPYGPLVDAGAAHFATPYGPEGVLIVLGGNNQVNPTAPESPILLDTVYIFDPVSKRWSSQPTSGETPLPRENHCMVGVEGDSGTYEIFMYGGDVISSTPETVNAGAVWVLTLPAFHWKEVPNPPPFGRWLHRCEIVGKRQMAVIGGKIGTLNVDVTNTWASIPDPWDQGIGIFDMSELEWKSSYDHSAAKYVTPPLVKNYYAKHGSYPKFQHKAVEGWFTKEGKVQCLQLEEQ